MLRTKSKRAIWRNFPKCEFNSYDPGFVWLATDLHELHDPEVWGRSWQQRRREPAGSDSGQRPRDFSQIQKFGEVGNLRIALSPRTRVRWAKVMLPVGPRGHGEDIGHLISDPPPIPLRDMAPRTQNSNFKNETTTPLRNPEGAA